MESTNFIQVVDRAPNPPATMTTTCPSCGYCPHCGRGGQQFVPYYPQYPYYPYYPNIPWGSGSATTPDYLKNVTVVYANTTKGK